VSGEFGGLIRQSRERLGLTPSRVAELIGRAPGTVRAWEKGTSIPSDPAVVSSLAAVLGIDEVTLFEAAGLEPPVSETSQSVRQALSTITPAARLAEARDSGQDRTGPESVTTADPEPETTGEVVGDEAVATPNVGRRRRRGESPQPPTPADLPTAVVPPPAVPPVPEPVAREPRHRASRGGIMEQLRGATVRRPAAVAAPTTLPPAPASPSYLEDPNERWSYRLRALYTAAGVVALFVALGWAGSNLFDALGQLWEVLTENL
jgi:transcriptional regulator with XRE-family HTH domain